MTVAAELAAALHHSRDVGPGTHVGLRAQKTGSSGGRRPGVLKEPEPPVVVEHAACPCSGAPLLVVPSLAAAESDCVDGTSLKYLLKLALKEREEEVERMRREEEEAARSELISLIRVPQEHRTADQVRRITAASRILATAHKRKRKKRRKKKTPKSSSFRSSSGVRPRRCGRGSGSRLSSSGDCGRLREHVRQVPAVADLQWKVLPSISSTKWWTFQLCYGDRYGCLQVQYSDKVVSLPGVVLRLALMVQRVQKPVVLPQAQYLDKVAVLLCGRSTPLSLAHEFFPWSRPVLDHSAGSPSWRTGRFHGPESSSDHGHFQVAVADVPVVQVETILG